MLAFLLRVLLVYLLFSLFSRAFAFLGRVVRRHASSGRGTGGTYRERSEKVIDVDFEEVE